MVLVHSHSASGSLSYILLAVCFYHSSAGVFSGKSLSLTEYHRIFFAKSDPEQNRIAYITWLSYYLSNLWFSAKTDLFLFILGIHRHRDQRYLHPRRGAQRGNLKGNSVAPMISGKMRFQEFSTQEGVLWLKMILPIILNEFPKKTQCFSSQNHQDLGPRLNYKQSKIT